MSARSLDDTFDGKRTFNGALTCFTECREKVGSLEDTAIRNAIYVEFDGGATSAQTKAGYYQKNIGTQPEEDFETFVNQKLPRLRGLADARSKGATGTDQQSLKDVVSLIDDFSGTTTA